MTDAREHLEVYRKVALRSWRDDHGRWYAEAAGYPLARLMATREDAINELKNHIRQDPRTKVNKDPRRPQKIGVDPYLAKP